MTEVQIENGATEFPECSSKREDANMNAEGKNLDLTGHEVARKIRGNPSLITACGAALEILSESDWLYLLDHLPNSEEVVSRCTKWQQFNIDDLCDLLCKHPQLGKHCPDSVWSRFKGGHWARLIMAGKSFRSYVGNDEGVYSFYVDKMTALGLNKTMLGDWCCVWHWAEKYVTCFDVCCAAAASDEEKIRRIANESAINPDKACPGLGGGLAHIKWLASIAKDCAEMAAITDEAHARNYALIAQAANLQAQKMASVCINRVTVGGLCAT